MIPEEYESKMLELKNRIKSYPDFPKEGILFRDIFSILRDATSLKTCLELMLAKITQLKWNEVDIVVGLESRGFILAPLLAVHLNAGFVPIRKKGRLPGKCKEVSYALEYRSDVFEVQDDSIQAGQKVLVVDDLIATGGSLAATCKLLKGMDATITGCLAFLELVDLKGADSIDTPVQSIIQF